MLADCFFRLAPEALRQVPLLRVETRDVLTPKKTACRVVVSAS